MNNRRIYNGNLSANKYIHLSIDKYRLIYFRFVMLLIDCVCAAEKSVDSKQGIDLFSAQTVQNPIYVLVLLVVKCILYDYFQRKYFTIFYFLLVDDFI